MFDLLDRTEAEELSGEFAKAVPDGMFSMAAMQGYLMDYKLRPREAVENVKAFVETERTKRGQRADGKVQCTGDSGQEDGSHSGEVTQ